MSTWSDWNRITRFFKSATLALEREALFCRSIPFADPRAVELSTVFGNGRYNVSLAHHMTAVNDAPLLCALVLVFSYAIAEEAARAYLSPSPANGEPIEQWGLRLLKLNGRDWSALKGGCASLVEVAIARNAVAHGLPIDQHMINRITQYGGSPPWSAGDRVILTALAVEDYRARLRGLLRVSGVR